MDSVRESSNMILRHVVFIALFLSMGSVVMAKEAILSDYSIQYQQQTVLFNSGEPIDADTAGPIYQEIAMVGAPEVVSTPQRSSVQPAMLKSKSSALTFSRMAERITVTP